MSISDSEFIELVLSSSSNSDVLRKLGLKTRGGASSKLLKYRISELKINTDHYKVEWKARSTKFSMDEILVENSSYSNISRMKKRILENKLLDYRCVKCDNDGVWNSQPMTLQLDHINGISNDHRLVNLRFLCPNCHSQTDTYSGRNK